MIVPIILAAGESKRLGVPKALLPLHGKTLLQHAVDKCRAARLEPIVVLGCAADVLRLTVNARAVVNRDWKRGMLSSLQAGLRAMPARARAFMIYPVDCALVPAAAIRKLAAAYDPSKLIFVPTHRGHGGHPVMLDARLKREMLAERKTARDVVYRDSSRVKFVPVNTPAIRFDVDTAADYRRALRLVRMRVIRT